MGLDPTARLADLVARGETLASLERLLHLSPGYLSKVRRGRAAASPQLAALVEILARHPEVRATLAESAPSAGARSRLAPAGRPREPAGFARALAAAWRRAAARFVAVDDPLLRALRVDVPAGVEPSERFLVHPDDRRALAAARGLGAAVAMASSHAFVCSSAGGRAIVVVVFPLAPFHPLFDRPRLTPVDAALYFALQAGDDAEARMRAVVAAHGLSRPALERALRAAYGRAAPLPAREWLLRATFDPDLASARLAALGGHAPARAGAPRRP